RLCRADAVGLRRTHTRGLTGPDVDGLDRSYRHGLQTTDRDLLRGADPDRLVRADLFAPVDTNGERFVRPNRRISIDANIPLLVLPARFRIVDVDAIGAAVVDGRRLVVLDDGVHVELAVDEHPFGPGRVVERHLVEARPLVGVGLHAADHRTSREAEGRQLLGVVDPPRDD